LAIDEGCAGTRIAGTYSNSTYSILQSPVLDLRGVAGARLRFHHWFNTENLDDGANLKISTDGGRTFALLQDATFVPPSRLYTTTLSTASTNPMRLQRGWTSLIPGGQWEVVEVDLDGALAGLARDQVVIRWDFSSDSGTVAPGWYVDAVRIGDPAGFTGIKPGVTTAPPTTANQGVP